MADARQKIETIKKWYRATALVLLNTVVIFIVLNLIMAAVGGIQGWLKHRNDNALYRRYGGDAVLQAYPDKKPEQVGQLLHETWSHKMAFEPFTLFREESRQGTYVNVHPAGFRLGKNQGPWPISSTNFNVFVFGGSTTFGYGVEDSETIPSHLQEILRAATRKPVAVYNFGRGFYASPQERILFEQLLLSQSRPQVAVFIDGLNDFYYGDGKVEFQDDFSLLVSGRIYEQNQWQFTDRFPLVRTIKNSDIFRGLTMPDTVEHVETPEEMRAMARRVIERYLANQKIIAASCASFGIRPCFVFQPVPNHRCPVAMFPFEQPYHERSQYGYAEMEQFLAHTRMPDTFLYLGGMQEGATEPLYVDGVHYNGRMSRLMAQRIAARLADLKALPMIPAAGGEENFSSAK